MFDKNAIDKMQAAQMAQHEQQLGMLSEVIRAVRALDKGEREAKTMQLFVGPNGVGFSKEGYAHAIMYVTNAVTLSATYQGIAFSVALQSGANPVEIPEGATLESTTVVTVLLILSNHQSITNDVALYGLGTTSTSPLFVQATGSSTTLPVQIESGNGSGQSLLVYPFGVGAGQNLQGMIPTASGNFMSNGTNWDPQQNNTQGTLLASAARTATVLSANQTNYNGDSVTVFLNITSVPTTPSTGSGLIVRIFGVDPATGNTDTLHADPSLATSIANFVYQLGVGNSGATGGTVALRIAGSLPRVWGAAVVVSTTDSYTYSLSFANN